MGKKSRLKKVKRREESPRSTAIGSIPLWMFALVALVAFLGVARSISFDFVDDDRLQILRNPWIRDWSNVVRFFTTDIWAFASTNTASNYYRPLHMLVYAAANSISGLEPQGYHLFNILLHIVSSLLVVLIGSRLTGSRFISAAGGLLFALHPIHTESVAWIAGVTDPLCGFFYFAALYFYIKEGQEHNSRPVLILSLSFFLGALLSKEMAFTFPLVAAWLDWCLHKKLRWSRYAMFAGVFFVYSVMRVTALHTFFVSNKLFDLDSGSRILSSIVLFGQYLAKMFVPYDISGFHVFEPTTSILAWNFWLYAAVIAALVSIALILRQHRTLLFLFGYSMITLFPLLNITGIGENVFADRYLYIPTLGSCLLIPLLARELMRFLPSRPPWLDLRVGAAILSALLAAWGWMLWNEISVWRDTPTFYLETMKRSPKAALIANSLGNYYFDLGDYEKAREWAEKGVALYDKSFIKKKRLLISLYLGIGMTYFNQGKIDQGREYFLKAYKESPNDEAVLQNLGAIWFAAKDYDQALLFYKMALNTNPRSEVIHKSLAALYLATGDYDKAIAQAQAALGIYPKSGDACLTLARAFAAKEMRAEARQAYLNLKIISPSQSGVADAEMKALGLSSLDAKR